MYKKMSIRKSILLSCAVIFSSIIFFTCSADDPGIITGTPVIMQGKMIKGSVIVNGVEFEISPSTSIEKDGVSGDESDLQDGMIVKLKGRVNDDNVTGTAEIVHSEDELQGNIESLDASANPQSLVILNQTVIVDDQTAYAGGLAGFVSLTVNDLVEIHGQRDSSGGIFATRIEKLTDGEVELKGSVASLSGTTFFIGLQEIDFESAAIEPAGGLVAGGERVEVKGSLSGGVLIADSLELKDLTEDPELEISDGEAGKVEGYISGLAEPSPGIFTFIVDGENVTTILATGYKGGTYLNLANDVKVEVEGISDGSSLIAAEIEFGELRVELEGTITGHSSTSITIFDLTVELNDFTESPESGIVDGQRYKVEAFIEGTAIIAESVESTGTGDDELQAPVEAKAGDPDWTLTILGIVIDASGSGIEFKGLGESTVTRDDFFAAVIPGSGTAGTLIKIQGDAFAGGTIPNVSEVQLED